MKKILITTGLFPPDIGGPATYVNTLVKELPKHDFDIRVVTYADTKSVSKIGSVKIIKIDRKQNIIFRYLDFTAAIIKNLNWADIVYTQGPVSEGFPTWLACKFKRKPYILKVVGDYAWEQYKQQGTNSNQSVEQFQKSRHEPKTEYRKKVQELVAKGAKQIITPSNYLKGIISQWGVNEEKIKVIYNAVEIPPIKEGKQTLKTQLGLKGDIILTAGRLVRGKGYETLIEIMPELLKGNANFKLIIAGSGPEKNSLQEIINSLNLEKNVFLAGQLAKNELLKLMKASDMFVLNSEHETMSNVIIEALNVGVPIIASNRGGNPEIIKNDHNGILVDCGDKEKLILNIVKLWHNRMAANDFIINGQKIAEEKFSKHEMISKLLNTLNK